MTTHTPGDAEHPDALISQRLNRITYRFGQMPIVHARNCAARRNRAMRRHRIDFLAQVLHFKVESAHFKSITGFPRVTGQTVAKRERLVSTRSVRLSSFLNSTQPAT